MNTPTRVLIVEDHTLVREGLCMLIANQSFLAVVGETGDGVEAESLVSTTYPDLVLLDLDLPGRHGIDIMTHIKRDFSHVKVLILTGSQSQHNIQEGLAAGADGYVVKHEGSSELLRAIDSVLAGECFVSPRVAAMTNSGPELTERAKTLTARELEIVAYLAYGKSNKNIADILSLSTHTVRTHRQNIMDKLDLHNAAQLVAWAIRRLIIR